MMVIRVMLLLLIAHQACGDNIPTYETELWGRPATAVIANVTLQPYAELLRWIIDVFTKQTTQFWGRPLLYEQAELWREPPKWITLNLLGRGTDRTTLLVRSDNLYLIGFNTSNGVWYAFRGCKHLIPNSIELPYSFAYSSLLSLESGGKWRLKYLTLGLQYYLDSLSALSDYPTHGRLDLGIALVKILLMTIEAARFNRVGQTVNMHWTSYEGGHIDDTLAKHIVSWGDMSYLLLCSKDGFSWAGEEADDLADWGIGNINDALNALGIILYPKQYNPDNPDNCKSTTVAQHVQYLQPGN